MCIVHLMRNVNHMCLLACNVCGGITAVAFSCCGILHVTLCGSTSGPAWYPSCPVISGKLPSSGRLHYLWFISVCVGHLSTVLTPSRHCFYSTEIIFYLFAACPIYPAKVSHYYRPTSVDTASVHIVKGITKNIHNTNKMGSVTIGTLLVENEVPSVSTGATGVYCGCNRLVCFTTSMRMHIVRYYTYTNTADLCVRTVS